MSANKNSSKTSVLCYFCNESFASSYLLQGHIKLCASTLQQCNRCRAYLERRHMEEHVSQCLSKESTSNYVHEISAQQNSNQGQNAQQVPSSGQFVQQNPSQGQYVQQNTGQYVRMPNTTKAHLVAQQNIAQVKQDQQNMTQGQPAQLNITQAQYHQPNMTQAQVTQQNITQVQMNQQNMTQAQMNQQNMIQAQMNQQNMTKAQVNQQNMTQARLNQQHMAQSQLNQQNMAQAQLNQQNMTQAQINQHNNTQRITQAQLQPRMTRAQLAEHLYTTTSTLKLPSNPGYQRSMADLSSQGLSLSQPARDIQGMATSSNGQDSWDRQNGLDGGMYPQRSQNRSSLTRPKSTIYESQAQQIFREEIEVLSRLLEEERDQREVLMNEMSKMKRQYVLSEERNQILLSTISTLRKTIEEEAEKCNNLHKQAAHQEEINKAKYEELSSRTSRMEMTFLSLQKDIEKEQIERSHLDLIVNGQDAKLRILNQFETDLESVRNDLNQEQQLRREVMAHIQQEASQTKEMLSREITINKHQLKSIEATQSEAEEKLQRHEDDISKYQLLRIESKTVKQTVDEDSIKVLEMDKNVKELMENVQAIQRERFSGHLSDNNANVSVESLDFSGHLLWKIGNFEEKLKDSVENESVLLSPIFYSNKYGYALQAELYLNGLGKWRGRHITATVLVIPGKWDPILAWPAQLSASIALKDQTPKRSQAIDIVKTLLVRKKELQDDFVRSYTKDTDSVQSSDRSSARSSNHSKSTENLSSADKDKRTLESNMRKQYVFIPHASLDKFDYIKNDAAFVEIIVTNL